MSGFVECHHILLNGRKCRSAALRGKPFCYFHAKMHFQKTVRRKPANASRPTVVDITSLQIAVAKALTALSSPFIDTCRAGLLLYGLNIAASLIKRAPLTLSAESLSQSQCQANCSPALTIANDH